MIFLIKTTFNHFNYLKTQKLRYSKKTIWIFLNVFIWSVYLTNAILPIFCGEIVNLFDLNDSFEDVIWISITVIHAFVWTIPGLTIPLFLFAYLNDSQTFLILYDINVWLIAWFISNSSFWIHSVVILYLWVRFFVDSFSTPYIWLAIFYSI